MELPLIVIFFAGMMIGLIIHPMAGMLQAEGIVSILDRIGRMVAAPFVPLARFLRERFGPQKARHSLREQRGRRVDVREQQINDSVRTLRTMMSSLTSVIYKTDKATNDSSQTLEDVKKGIEHAALPRELADANLSLIAEIDRVIASNADLQGELANSRVILEDQKRQIEDLKNAVRIDGLTQLANRAYFDEKLNGLLSMRDRYNERLSLMMIDIDNFKEINDRHGHLAGDRVLRGVAFTIKSDLRESDFLARFGGDEFAVLIIKADCKVATEIAWKVCTNVREARFVLDDTELRTTISIGVAESLPGETAEHLIMRADAALYHVKQHGRNGVNADEATSG